MGSNAVIFSFAPIFKRGQLLVDRVLHKELILFTNTCKRTLVITTEFVTKDFAVKSNVLL